MARRSHIAKGILASLIFAFGPSVATAAEPSTDKPKQNFPAIVVTEAVTGHLVDRIVATGTVKPVQEIFVQPLLEGLAVKSLHADVGDAVEANGVLATLNDDSLALQKAEMEANRAKAQATIAQLQAQIVETRANAEESQRQRDRAVTMAQKGTASTAQAEQATAASTAANARVRAAEYLLNVAEAELKVVDAQIADLNLKLARTDIKTPYAGVVAIRNAKVGAIATGVGEPLFTVIRDGALELVADVPESDILKIKSGQKATITLAGGSDALTGSVRLVSPTVDQTTRLGAVHIEIDDSERARSGMYGSATIVVKETDGLALPLTAITVTRSGATARKVEDGVVKLVQVETGILDGTNIQIVSGLKPGDEVVAKAGAYVRDGDRITPVRQPEPLSN